MTGLRRGLRRRPLKARECSQVWTWTAPQERPRTNPRKIGFTLLGAGCGGNLGGKVRLVLLDALTKRIAHETGDLDRRASVLFSVGNGLGHGVLAIDDEDLGQKGHFLVILADAAFDHLFDD